MCFTGFEDSGVLDAGSLVFRSATKQLLRPAGLGQKPPFYRETPGWLDGWFRPGADTRSGENSCYGVYQIGDVYARSCVVIGISPGMSRPKRTAS